MEITSSVEANMAILALTGQLWRKEDLKSLEVAVETVLTGKRPFIVIDIHRVSFVNSQGLGLFVKCHSKAKKAGIQFILFRPNEAVAEVIELSGFKMFMIIMMTPEELNKFVFTEDE